MWPAVAKSIRFARLARRGTIGLSITTFACSGKASCCTSKRFWSMTIGRIRTERLHEGRLVPVDIPDLAVPQCGNCGEMVFDYAADEQILEAVRRAALTHSVS